MTEGFDILSFDLYNPGLSNRNTVFDYHNTQTTLDGKHVYPAQFELSELNVTDFVAESLQFFNAYDMQRAFSSEVSASGGFDGFKCSGSASYSSFNEWSGSGENVVIESHAVALLWRLRLNTDIALPLSADFKQRVAALPADYSSGRQTYMDFINDFGTHYATEAIFGGRTYQIYTLTAAEAASLTRQNVDISMSASDVLGDSVHANVNKSSSNWSEFSNTVTQTAVEWVGGTASNNFNDWVSSLAQAPVIVRGSLNNLYALLTAENFPNVGNIDQIKNNMTQAYGDYMQGGSSVPVQPVTTYKWTSDNGGTLLPMSTFDYQLASKQTVNFEGRDWTVAPTVEPPYAADLGAGSLAALAVANYDVAPSTIKMGEDVFIKAGNTSAPPYAIYVMQGVEESGVGGVGGVGGCELTEGLQPGIATWQIINPLNLNQKDEVMAGPGYLYQIRNTQTKQFLAVKPTASPLDPVSLVLTDDASDPWTYWNMLSVLFTNEDS
jgi:hypothetical protein